MPIFDFIVAKCKIPNLHVHCFLIEKFLTNNMLNSVSGYYLTTLEASMGNVIEAFKNFISQNKNISPLPLSNNSINPNNINNNENCEN